VLVAIMHEGAMYDGAANDPSYACTGLKGRGVDIAKRLDPAYAIIISGHTHQAYTCKIDGRLLVQAGSFGGWLTESRLTLDTDGTRSGRAGRQPPGAAGHVCTQPGICRPGSACSGTDHGSTQQAGGRVDPWR
jgi:hypothetical protein